MAVGDENAKAFLLFNQYIDDFIKYHYNIVNILLIGCM